MKAYFLRGDGSVFAILRKLEEAKAIWDMRKYRLIIDGKMYTANDWEGRKAIERFLNNETRTLQRKRSPSTSKLMEKKFRDMSPEEREEHRCARCERITEKLYNVEPDYKVCNDCKREVQQIGWKLPFIELETKL